MPQTKKQEEIVYTADGLRHGSRNVCHNIALDVERDAEFHLSPLSSVS